MAQKGMQKLHAIADKFGINRGTLHARVYKYKIPLDKAILMGISAYDNRTKHPLYQTWSGMMQRCFNEKCPCYNRYGGRGIKVCEAWTDFWVFAKEVPEKPFKSYEIDRIDNDRGYEPGNIRWVTSKRNSRNLSKTIKMDDGRIFADVCEENGIPRRVGLNRIAAGWSKKEASSIPIQKGRYANMKCLNCKKSQAAKRNLCNSCYEHQRLRGKPRPV